MLQALIQIEERKYHEKYLSSGKSIQLIGVGFDREEKNISHYKVKPVRMVGKIEKGSGRQM